MNHLFNAKFTNIYINIYIYIYIYTKLVSYHQCLDNYL